MSNNVKYGIGIILNAIVIMFCTGSVLQTFLLECGFSEKQVYLYNAMIQGVQVVVMVISIFFSDFIKKITKAVGFMHLAWLFFLFALFFLSGNRKGNIALSIGVMFTVAFFVYCVYGIQSVELYRLPYSIIDIKDYGKVSGITTGLSGAACFGISVLYSYLVTNFDFFSISTIFFVLSAVFCVCAFLSYFTMKERPIPVRQMSCKNRDLKIFKNKKMYWLLLPNFVRGIATGIVGLLTVIGFSKGILNRESASYMNIALQVATFGGNLFFAFFCQKFSSRNLLIISTFVFCLLLPFSVVREQTVDFILIYFIVRFFLMIIDVAIPVLVTEIISYEQIGAFTAIRLAVFTFGSAVASLVMDWLIGVVENAYDTRNEKTSDK